MPKRRSLSMHFRYCVKCSGGGRLYVVIRFGAARFARCAECPRLFLFCFCTCLLCCVRYSDNWLFFSPPLALSSSRALLLIGCAFPLAQVHPRGYVPPKIWGRRGFEKPFVNMILLNFSSRQSIAHRTIAACHFLFGSGRNRSGFRPQRKKKEL